jgi:DNA-directed RNA polymerase specialized sigma24 family protein
MKTATEKRRAAKAYRAVIADAVQWERRKAISMLHGFGWTAKEIAEVVGLAHQTVRNILSKG